MKIGVLSLQGGVIEHINHIKALGEDAIEVKNVDNLKDIDGIIIPGGESTTISKILNRTGLMEPLREKILSGLPTLGTCAGMILLAKEIVNDTLNNIAVMDISVKRNAYGSQLDSFEVTDKINGISTTPIPLVFIRAPYIVDVKSNVKILHKVNGNIVAARQNNMLALSFHPELTNNLDFHKYFLNMINNCN